jgi:hypothetical protein
MFGQRLICMKSKDTQWHNQKVDVWCATSWNRIISPLYFDNTINLKRHHEVILYLFISHLNEDKTARTHRACVSMTLLRDVSEGRIISNNIWPPWSPDLTSLDYQLWEQWKVQFTKTILTLSLNWRKPL